MEAAVTRILESHLLLRKFINAANCFEHKTILDIINNDLVRHESMAVSSLRRPILRLLGYGNDIEFGCRSLWISC